MLDWLEKMHVRAIAWLALGGCAAAFGFFPLIFPGFERADDAVKIQNRINEVSAKQDQRASVDDYRRAIDDAKSILQLKGQECTVPATARTDVYRQPILDLAQECIALAGSSGRPVKCDIPACGDL